MHAQLAKNYNDAVKALRANLTPRQIELETLERYIDGSQYEGRPDWFNDECPLFDRAPCIVYTLAQSAIRSNVDLVLGESRFPAITANPGEDDADAGGLDEKKSEAIDRALSELFTRVRFHAVARQAFGHVQATKSIATIVGVRKGKPFLENVRSRWCVPELDDDGCVLRLEIRYPYLEWEKRADGTWWLNARLYRRVIDDTNDVTYKPLVADPGGKEPPESAWTVATEVAHGLGFCPVVWHGHMKECSTVADYDGEAIHEHLLDEIRALDFALSVRHRAALFTGNPVVTECGVEPGSNPGEKGVTAEMPGTLAGGRVSNSNPAESTWVSPNTRKSARRLMPGSVWQYESKDVKVAYLTLPPGALEALDENAADIRNKIVEGLAVVPLDPENVKFAAAMSGKAIETLRARQFDRCDQFRDDFGAGWLIPVVLMLLRVCLATAVKIKSVNAVSKTLAAFVADDGSAPMLTLRWPGSYTKPDPTDEQAIVTAVTTAYEKKVITLRSAVQKLQAIFGYANVDQALAMLEEEVQKAKDEAAQQMQDAAGALHGVGAMKKKPKPDAAAANGIGSSA